MLQDRSKLPCNACWLHCPRCRAASKGIASIALGCATRWAEKDEKETRQKKETYISYIGQGGWGESGISHWSSANECRIHSCLPCGRYSRHCKAVWPWSQAGQHVASCKLKWWGLKVEDGAMAEECPKILKGCQNMWKLPTKHHQTFHTYVTSDLSLLTSADLCWLQWAEVITSLRVLNLVWWTVRQRIRVELVEPRQSWTCSGVQAPVGLMFAVCSWFQMPVCRTVCAYAEKI